MPGDPVATRRAAVVGKPVEHSLSPVLHGAAYAELGLDWSYERVEADEHTLPALVAGLGPEWAGLSVTMPGKAAALALASSSTDRAVAVGAANTLVHKESGDWHADCTDVDGVVGALRAAGFRPGGSDRAVVLGAGGTARAALAGLAALDVAGVTVVVREPSRAGEAVACAERLGLPVEVSRWDTTDLASLAEAAAVLVSTVPVAATAPVAAGLARADTVLDVIYHPWPTPLAEAVLARGARIATGLDMLLHQAFGQVEQFTGRPAPREVMRTALRDATGGMLELPL
ncbi:shikimate dehydrogenase [Herbihabitans rhizosphaerae]|uniref:Shikimate dehydrogenase n=1 Tax=Herbihabitans rhizosphaerae TaxID=1872711 RepID=A0A4Q7L3Y0_9PSEU|nr:shikimate dehydrogenase [Herbihabitans rhizosphaerae]RZS43171.1 shikimate dehydrogenase [Herbihabitans rhizosphaerae]